MALGLSLKVGEDFYVRDERIVVHEVQPGNEFWLCQESTGELFHITRAIGSEIFPDVIVSASEQCEGGIAKINIEAPRVIRIIRGDRYRRPSVDAIEEYIGLRRAS